MANYFSSLQQYLDGKKYKVSRTEAECTSRLSDDAFMTYMAIQFAKPAYYDTVYLTPNALMTYFPVGETMNEADGSKKKTETIFELGICELCEYGLLKKIKDNVYKTKICCRKLRFFGVVTHYDVRSVLIFRNVALFRYWCLLFSAIYTNAGYEYNSISEIDGFIHQDRLPIIKRYNDVLCENQLLYIYNKEEFDKQYLELIEGKISDLFWCYGSFENKRVVDMAGKRHEDTDNDKEPDALEYYGEGEW